MPCFRRGPPNPCCRCFLRSWNGLFLFVRTCGPPFPLCLALLAICMLTEPCVAACLRGLCLVAGTEHLPPLRLQLRRALRLGVRIGVQRWDPGALGGQTLPAEQGNKQFPLPRSE